MLEVRSLRKTYGDLVAVHDVSFTLRPGEVVGLLGPNGAGKTTTVSMIAGLITPAAGQVLIDGAPLAGDTDPKKQRIGLVPQDLALYDELSALQNLRFFGALYDLGNQALEAAIASSLQLVGLTERARDRVGTFSGGMKRRLNFACGIVHRPKVLLLDEPTVGVDPQTRARLLDLVRQEAEAGTCVLYTTHYMEEAQSLCRTIGIIDHGRLIALGTLEELRGLIARKEMVRLTGRFEPAATGAALAGLAGIEVVQMSPESLLLALADGSRQVPALFSALEGAGAVIRETTLSPPSLESLFLKLTGKELRE